MQYNHETQDTREKFAKIIRTLVCDIVEYVVRRGVECVLSGVQSGVIRGEGNIRCRH